MKHWYLEQVKNWFGFTRRERRSSFILLLLILVIAGIRFIIPERNISLEVISSFYPETFPDSLPNKKPVVSNQVYRPENASRQPRPILDINVCDSSSLEELPGIGPVLSARVIKYRNLLGGYARVSQLREVYGLTEETFDLISGRLKADSAVVRKIIINSADYKQLIRLPYFEKYEVSAILKFRELNGKISDIKDLIDNKLITVEKAKKVSPYLEFGK